MNRVRRVTLRIDAEQLAQAVLEVVGRPEVAAAVVERAKARASLDVEFETETEGS